MTQISDSTISEIQQLRRERDLGLAYIAQMNKVLVQMVDFAKNRNVESLIDAVLEIGTLKGMRLR